MAEKVLTNDFRDKAERLALLPYSVVVIRDEDSDGNPVFLAVNTELDGCMADGKTSEEAIENLKDARADYIQVLLLSGEPVPTPYVVQEIAPQPENVGVVKTVFYQEMEDKLTDIHSDGDKVLAKYTFKWLPLNA